MTDKRVEERSVDCIQEQSGAWMTVTSLSMSAASSVVVGNMEGISIAASRNCTLPGLFRTLYPLAAVRRVANNLSDQTI